MPNPVIHFEVVGKDGEALRKFYTNLFGWKIDANNPLNYGIVNAEGESGIGGGVGEDPTGNHPGVTFYAEVADLQATLDKAVSLGGKVVMPVTEIPNMVTLAQFSDPEGHMIGLVKSAQ